VRRDAVDGVELEGDERNPGEREVSEQHSGDGDHLEFLLDDVATSGVRVTTKSKAHMRHRYHLRPCTQPELIRDALFRLPDQSVSKTNGPAFSIPITVTRGGSKGGQRGGPQ